MTIEKWTNDDYRNLKVRVGNAKLVVKRFYFNEGQAVEVSFNYFRTDNFSLFYRTLEAH